MVKSIKKGLAIALAAVMVFSISPFVGKSETVKAETVELADVDCSNGFQTMASEGIELESGKTVTVNFTNKTNEGSTNYYKSAAYWLYYNSEKFAGGTGSSLKAQYEELSYGRADNVQLGPIITKNTYKSIMYGTWDSFLNSCLEGASGTVIATRYGNSVRVVMSLAGAYNIMTYTNVDASKKLYLSLSGEDTVLSGVTYTTSTADISELNSSEFIGWWTNHTRGIKLEKGTTTSIKFVNTSYAEAEGTWHSVLYDLYYDSEEFAGGSGIDSDDRKNAGYAEIFVGRGDNAGWSPNGQSWGGNLGTGYTYETSGTFSIDQAKAGAEGTITASLDEAGTKVTVTMSIAGATNTLTYTGVDSSKGSVYLALTGERCRLSDLSYSCYYSDISNYRDGTKTAPDSIYGTKFAGWFSDAECTTPIEDDATGAYAKFVDSNLLNLRYQLRAATDSNSESTSVRIMLGVDSLNYKNVGFAGTFNGKDLGKLESKKVCKSIDITEQDVTALEAPSKYFGNSAEYMLPYALLNIKKANFDKDLVVKPYWTTLDGTVVYGEEKTIKVEDCL